MSLEFTEHLAGGLRYRMHRPANAGGNLPLILFLHGVGERGEDNRAQTSYPFFSDQRSLFNTTPAIVVAPQAGPDEKWISITEWRDPAWKMPQEPAPPMKQLIARLGDIIGQPGVDRGRIYLTGLSMGGFGVFDLIARCPGVFAAGVVVCGRGDPAMAARYADVPLMLAHGGMDPLIPAEYSRIMSDSLRKLGSSASLLIYPELGHDAWNRAYTDPAVIKWMFGQRRQP